MLIDYNIASVAKQDCEALFELRGVTKTFKTPLSNPLKPRETITALESVSLAIRAGKVTCLLGPNGAGKTTLIKILAALILPDAGAVDYRGTPYAAAGRSLRGRIGLVTPNERAFYWRLSGRENLLFFGSLYGFRGARLRGRVDEVLEATGMLDSAEKPYRLYSAGMKQKLNIARALLGDPELYLLDEPVAHLDPFAREEFHAFLREVLVERRGATILLCTHDLAEAEELAEDIVVLDEGRIVAQGERRALLGGVAARREVLLSYSGERPRAWLDGERVNLRDEGPGLARVSFDPSEIAQEDIIAAFVAAGGRLSEASASADSLYDFIKRIRVRHA